VIERDLGGLGLVLRNMGQLASFFSEFLFRIMMREIEEKK